MAGFGEPWEWTKQREEEAKTIFPTLEVANPDEIMDVDMFRFQNLNQPPTNFSQSALSLANYANIPEPTPEAPDVAPNVEGWTPRISPPQAWGEPTYDPSRPDTLLQRTPGFTPLELYQRVSQGSLGFFTGATPSESARRFVSGVEGEETFSPYELGFVRNLPEGSALREPLARIEAQLVDPINLLTMGQAGAARAIATGIIGEEATRAAARAFGASPETQETLGTIANIAGNIIPVRPKTWMQAADEALGVQQAAERAAVPEALQIGRAAGEGRVPFYGGTRPGEVPIPLGRPSMVGAADLFGLSDDAIDASINAIRNAETAGRPVQPGIIDELLQEKASRTGGVPTPEVPAAVPEAAVAPETAAAGGVPPKPPAPPTIPGRGGYVPSNEFKSTPTLTRLYGVETIKEGKTRGLGERFGMTGRIRADDPIVTPAMTVRNEARNAVVNQATRITTQVRNAVRRSGFEFDEFGRIPALQGVDPTLEFEGTAIAPTLRDVAARLPNFENALTQQQRNALEEIRNAIQPYRTALDEVRAVEESITGKPSLIAIGSRQDVMDGGFYIPRGNAETEEMAEIAAGRLRRPGRGGAGKQGFEQTATFPSESYGIELGYNYTPVDEAVGSYVRGAGNRAIDRHVANYLISRVDETGKRIAKKLADSDTRLTGRVSLAGLDQYSFPAALADEAEKEIRSTRMSDSQASAALKFVNDTMRGVQATGEMSYLGIQNAIGNIVEPAAGSASTKASLKAWLNAGDEVLGDYIARFDVKAAEAARPTSEKWAASGLRLGESGTEFQTVRKLPRKFSEKLEQAPEIVKKVGGIPRSIAERADRGFGVAGDTMRLELADTMAEEWMAKYGRSLTNKELKTIAESVNRVTGWTGEKFFNNWADFLNFAPRYLTARFRSVGQLASSDPMKRQLARRLVGRYVGIMSALTLAGNYLNGEETDFRPFSGSKGPTFNPLDAEYKNPNFMRLKNVMGRDWSLLGPIDSVLGTSIAIGSLATNPTGNPVEVSKRMRAVLTAPLASAGNDWIVQHETFDGRPLRLDTPEGIQDIAKRFAPFGAVQIAPDIARAAGEAAGGDYLKAASDSAGSAIAGFFGGRGSRLTPRERVIEGEYYKLTPDEQLRALPAQSWREIGKNEKVPENLRNVINEYQSIAQWKDAAYASYYKRAIDAGYTKSAADKWAQSKVESNQISNFYNTAKNYYESEWIKNNPRLAEEIIVQDKNIEDPRKKRLSPRKEDIAVIQQALGK